jgi:hypothetical protein
MTAWNTPSADAVGELKVGLCLTFSNAEFKNATSVFEFK